MESPLDDYYVSNEYHLIGTVVPVLLRYGIITKTEGDVILNGSDVSERKTEFYDLLLSKSFESATRILAALHYKYSGWEIIKRQAKNSDDVSDEELDTDDDDEDPKICYSDNKEVLLTTIDQNLPVKNNPMLHNVVIERVLNFVSFKDLKIFRLVSQQWNFIAQTIIRKDGIIHFQVQPHFSKFNDVFDNSSATIPFNSIKFTKSGLFLSEVESFFSKWSKYIIYLEFHSIILINQHGKEITENFDITPWIKELNLDELQLFCEEGARLAISACQLLCVKKIGLHECIVLNIEKAIKICPLEISLRSVRYFSNNVEVMGEFEVNNIFDFSKATYIFISHGELYSPVPVLDLANEVVDTQTADLYSVCLKNGLKSRWKVDFLTLQNTEISKEWTWQIKKVEFNYNEKTTYDLSDLPTSVEKISFFGPEDHNSKNIVCSQPKNLLPNLKLLQISEIYDMSFISHFAECENLKNLDLNSPCSGPFSELKLDWIPKNVTKIKFSYREVNIENIDIDNIDRKFRLITLILEGNSVDNAVELVQKLQPEFLVMKWPAPYYNEAKKKIDDFADYLLSLEILKRVIVNLSEIPFRRRSRFFKHLKGRECCYAFDKRGMKVISESEYELHANLY